LPPGNAFSLEEQPKRPGFALVRFYENVREFSETRDGLTVSGYEYDEYHLELPDNGDLQDVVLNEYDRLLGEAKRLDAEKTPPPDSVMAQLRADIEYISMMTGVAL
jgi:hypothetical protein